MAIQKTTGFVLRRQDLRETSIILTAYTRDFGKVRLVSKGVRNPEQRFVSSYELFALDEIIFYEKKKRDFFLLSQCELLDYFPKVRETLARLSHGVYLVELLDFVTALGEKNVLLYELLLNSLRLLSSKASPKRVARIFEIKLLSLLGFMPRLKACANCGKGPEKEKARFSFSLGGVLCEACFGRDRKARPILGGTVNFISSIEKMPFEKVAQIRVVKGVGVEVERLLKSFINYHLGVRPRSREFMEKIGV